MHKSEEYDSEEYDNSPSYLRKEIVPINHEHNHPPTSRQSFSESYDNITAILNKQTYRPKEMGFVSFCGIGAVLGSYYNFAFGKAYVDDVALRWNFSPVEAEIFSNFCGTMGLIINAAINGKSLHQAFYIVKDEFIKSSLNGKKMPDDNIIRISIGVMAVLSIIGATPNIKFVYDTTKDGNLIYLIVMEVIQFIIQFSLNLRGLHNTFKLNSEKKQVTQKFKLELLEAINSCLAPGNQISPEDLESLSKGILIRGRFQVLRTISKAGFCVYVGGYSAAFYFAVKNALPISKDENFFSDMLMFVITSCGLLSAALKWFFLGSAYINLIDRIFNLFQSPILKVNQNEVRSQYISRRTDRLLTLFGFIGAIFSLGSSSKIVEKYFFENQDKTAETFWLSLLIGGGAAFGINAIDLSTLIERIIDFVVYIYKTKICSSDGFLDHLGDSHDEMLMRVMLELSTMPGSTFLRKFAQEFSNEDVDIEALKEVVNKEGDQAPEKTASIYAHGYATTQLFHKFKDGCKQLSNNENNLPFKAFRELIGHDGKVEQLRRLSEKTPLGKIK